MTADTQIPESMPVAAGEMGSPQPQPVLPNVVRATWVFLPALATGGLLWLCYFPMNLGLLAWLALVPLLCLARAQTSGWRLFFASWLAGLVFYWPVMQWLRVADDRMYYTWAALSTYCSLYMPLAILLIRILDRRTWLPLTVTVPVVWTALEYFRGNFLTGFAWYFLGHTQHDHLAVIQVADLGGAYAVTFLVAAGNAMLFEALFTRSWFRRLISMPEREVRKPRARYQLAAVLFLLIATMSYGFWRLSQDEFAKGPVVALIQSNLPQEIRNQASEKEKDEAARTMLDQNSRLTDWACTTLPYPDLVVWPETSYPDEWVEFVPGMTSESSQVYIATPVASQWHTNVLLGLNSRVAETNDRWRRYNSAVLIQPGGAVGGRYDKMHRVLFGEYVPFREWLPWLNAFAPYDFDYSISPGQEFTRFPVGNYRFGVLICYEDSDPDLARQYVRPESGGQAVDFLVNISNDGWFDGTVEHEQHLAVCRFRAIECRRAVARAVNMGISGVIDGNGRVLRPEQGLLKDARREEHWHNNEYYREGHGPSALPGLDQLMDRPLFLRIRSYVPWLDMFDRRAGFTEGDLPVSYWPHYKKAEGAFVTAIPIDDRQSFYAQWGDWLPIGCWGIVLLGIIWGWIWPARKYV